MRVCGLMGPVQSSNYHYTYSVALKLDLGSGKGIVDRIAHQSCLLRQPDVSCGLTFRHKISTYLSGMV